MKSKIIDNKPTPFHEVGIGMPVYNGERYLEETIRSILLQTYDDFELVISDNASTDRTREICQDFAHTDKRVTYIHNPINLGASKNYTRCFEPANCKYFRWSNADDPIKPTLVEKCVKILDEDPDVVLAYCKTKIIDENGELLEWYDDNLDLPQDRAPERFIKIQESIGLSNVLYGLMRREALANTALLGNYLASDINLISEISLYGKYREVPEYLFSRRMHAQASSWDRDDEEKAIVFWDPSKKNLLMQVWRQMYEYTKGVLRAPIAMADKVAILRYLIKECYWAKGQMLNEIVEYVKFGLSKR